MRDWALFTGVNNPPPSPDVPSLAGAPAQRLDADFEPPQRTGSIRNLALGAGCVLLGIPIAGVAFRWAGNEAFVALSTAVVLGLVIFVATQVRLMRQRNGIFLLLSLGLLVTVTIPVGVKLFVSGSELATEFLAFSRLRSQEVGAGGGGPLPVATLPGAVGNPGVEPVGLSEPARGLARQDVVVESTNPPAPVLNRTTDEEAQRKSALVAQIEALDPQGKALFLARWEGADAEGRALLLSQWEALDSLGRTTLLAKWEAFRRYPSLETENSLQSQQLNKAYDDLARLRKFEFFKNPRWPLKLVEIVAQQEGWKRSDAAASEPVAAVAPPQPNLGKPVGSVLPGEELSLDGPQSPAAADAIAQATKRSVLEAKRRYPALGRPDSPESQIYIEAYSELQRNRPDFLEKPEWPIHLAEILAKREGWRRQDGGEATVGKGASSSVEPPLPK
ncbi:MAG: hypothetical protein RLZZ399_2375 [Verrucomicrobiota bacterium]